MAKKKVEPILEEIKKALKENKVIIGTERSIKALRHGKVAKVLITSNCNEEVKSDLIHYCKIANVELVELQMPNDELGSFCKKPFAISVLSFSGA